MYYKQAQELIAVLSRTVRLVKLIENGASRMITPTEGIRIAATGVYEWAAKPNRGVRWMRAVDPRGPHPWQSCYRTVEAPVLQPSIEWLWSRRAE